MTNKIKNLFYLDELTDFKVADDYSDVRNWDVFDVDNRNIGKVTNLLVNKATERVVYLDVEVDKAIIEDGYNTYQTSASDGVHGFINNEGDNHLIVPIGMVSLDEKNKKVSSNQITFATFAGAKRFSKIDHINSDYELFLLRHFSGDDAINNVNWDDNFYNRKEFKNTLQGKITDKS